MIATAKKRGEEETIVLQRRDTPIVDLEGLNHEHAVNPQLCVCACVCLSARAWVREGEGAREREMLGLQ